MCHTWCKILSKGFLGVSHPSNRGMNQNQCRSLLNEVGLILNEQTEMIKIRHILYRHLYMILVVTGILGRGASK